MPLFAEINFVDVLWSMIIFYFMVMWFVIVFRVIGDLFADHELSGFAKAVWCAAIIFLPFLSVLVYVIARGDAMAARSIQRGQARQAELDSYIRDTAGTASPASEISNAKILLDSGTISTDDFDKIKAKVLANA